MDEAKLRDIPMFAKLSRKQRKHLALRADEVEVQPGRLVCRKGDSANELYVIEEGTAKVVRDEQYLDELGPGDFFGEMGVLDHAPRNAHVVATHADDLDDPERRSPQGAAARTARARPADQLDDRAASSLARAGALTVSPNDTRSSAPPPAALAACTSPPCASAAWRTIARPRPEPGSARALSAR